MRKLILTFFILGTYLSTFASADNALSFNNKSENFFIRKQSACAVEEFKNNKSIDKKLNAPCKVVLTQGAYTITITAPTCQKALDYAFFHYWFSPTLMLPCTECAQPEGPNQITVEMFDNY